MVSSRAMGWAEMRDWEYGAGRWNVLREDCRSLTYRSGGTQGKSELRLRRSGAVHGLRDIKRQVGGCKSGKSRTEQLPETSCHSHPLVVRVCSDVGRWDILGSRQREGCLFAELRIAKVPI